MAQLLDTTLREGEQAFGVYFSPGLKRRLLFGLMMAGVEEIEIGCAGAEDLAPLLAWARARRAAIGGNTRFSVWMRLREEDMRLAEALQPDAVNVGAPASDAHLQKRMRLHKREMLRKVREGAALARDMGLRLSLGLEDASRADSSFLCDMAATAAAAGAFRVRLADTVGVLSPLQTAELVQRLRLAVGPETQIAAHCHNDCGMATANALTGLDAGADWADASLLGLGERAGLARLEELAGTLTLVRHTHRYDMARLTELSRMLAQFLGRRLDPARPMLGDRIFAVESGLHVDGVGKDPQLFEPFSPERILAARVVALGKKSGRAAVRQRLEELDAELAHTADTDALAGKVRTASARLGRPLDDAEVLELLAAG